MADRTAFGRWAFPLGLAIQARGNSWTTWEVDRG